MREKIPLVGIWLFDLTFAQGGKVLLGTTISRTTNDRTVIAWNLGTHELMWSQPIPDQSGLMLSHDGSWLATFDRQNLRLWDLPSGQLLRMFNRTFNVVAAIPNDRLLTLEQVASGSSVFQLNVRSGEVEAFLRVGSDIGRLAVQDPPQRIACLGAQLAVWDLTTLTKAMEIKPPGGLVFAFRPHSTELVVANWSGPLILDAQTGASLAHLTEGPFVHALAFSPDGRLLVTCHGDQADNHAPIEDQCVRVWDLERRALLRRIEIDGPGIPSALRIENDGTVLAAHSDTELSLWRFPSGG